MAAKWLLLEMFQGRQPTVIAVGKNPKRFLPLDRIIHHRTTLAEVRSVIAETAATFQQIERISNDGTRRTIAVPLPISPSRLHGVLVWSGPVSETPPPVERAGAWFFNISLDRSTRADDLLSLMGYPAADFAALREHSIAAVFADPLVPNYNKQGDALAPLVGAEEGHEVQQIWTLRRADGELRAAHYSCRISHEPATDGTVHKLVRGITHDIGPADSTPIAPPPTILEHRVLETSAEEGEFRAVFNTRTLQLLRWMGPPMPEIAWQALQGEPAPAIHAEDMPIAQQMAKGLLNGRTAGRVRIKALDGSWITVDARAVPMALDQSTMAALVTIRRADPDQP